MNPSRIYFRRKNLVGRCLLESNKKILPVKPLAQHDLKYDLRILKVSGVIDIFMK
jgi:hypothetical protein